MAYDEGLAERLRELLPKATEKRMFGGVAFMERGNLVAGVLGDELIARIGPDATPEALDEPRVRPFDFSGRVSAGWVMVASDAIEDDAALNSWVKRCRAFTKTLPAKEHPEPRRPMPRR